MPRTIAIGDIHGCSVAMARLLEAIGPQSQDTLVPLGDYVDRGLDSPGVLERLMALEKISTLVPLLGNHDQMLLRALDDPEATSFWLACGGQATLDAYAVQHAHQIPAEHVAFLKSCRPYFELDRHFFVHANYEPNTPLDEQDDETRYWLSLRDSVPGPHVSGKIAILGHTPQEAILNLGHLISIDTGCVYGGWLTALDVHSGQVWQTNQSGELRQGRLTLVSTRL